MVLSCWYQTILTTLYCWSHDKHCMWNENQRVKGKVKKCLIPRQILQLKKLLKVTAFILRRENCILRAFTTRIKWKLQIKRPWKQWKSSHERHQGTMSLSEQLRTYPPLTHKTVNWLQVRISVRLREGWVRNCSDSGYDYKQIWMSL